MNSIIKKVEKLKDSGIKDLINSRMKEFEDLGKKKSQDIFKELCFCFLTANFSAEGGIKIQKNIGEGFLTLNESEIAFKLKKLGHRFPNARARFVANAQIYKNNIKEIIEKLKTDKERREWLVKNIKGLGMKEASHFLRNIGYKNLAIIDFHIIDLLVKEGLIEHTKGKPLIVKRYHEIEKVLSNISKKTSLNLGELDLYLWYEETGKILK